MRSGTQLESPYGISDEVGSEKEQGKDVAPFPNENEPQKKRESKKPTES